MLVEFLLESGLSANTRVSHTPVFHSASTFEMVQLFLSHDVDVNIKSQWGHTILHKATTMNAATVHLLIDHKIDVNAQAVLKAAALFTDYQDKEVYYALLDRGADLDRVDLAGKTALHHIISRISKESSNTDEIKVIKHFLEHCTQSADVSNLTPLNDFVNFQDREGMSALHEATLKQNVDVVKILVESNADPLSVNTKKQTPLHIAAKLRNREILGILGTIDGMLWSRCVSQERFKEKEEAARLYYDDESDSMSSAETLS